MKKRRLQVAISDDEDEVAKPEEKHEERGNREVDDVNEQEELDDDGSYEDEEEVQEAEDAVPVGEALRVTGKGRKKKSHYGAFEFEGNQFELEDPVLLTPENMKDKPYVAIIKDITQDSENSMMITGQWFYRPEEAEKKGGGSWQPCDTRELFYSFHLDDVPAESVMHKCVVHFVPPHKQLPLRKQHPGFIVQRIYDTVEKKLWKLTDKDYMENNQSEIDSLVRKTRERIGELPDLVLEEPVADQEDLQKSKWNIRKKNIGALDVSRNDDTSMIKSDTLRRKNNEASSEYYHILSNFKSLTGTPHRDKWLEKLLQGIQYLCSANKSASADDKRATSSYCDKSLGTANGSKDNSMNMAKLGEDFVWPDDAVRAVTDLEKAAYEALGSDFQKYNQKMRQLDFNLKNNQLLTRRLLNKELQPSVVLTMSPAELKDGMSAEERSTTEPDGAERMQMTDARCSICTEKKVGVADVIHSGAGDRYQLECLACRNRWYASRDEISTLSINTSSVAGNVGTAPWATAKFDAVAKKLVSPRESEKKLVSPRESEKEVVSPRESGKKLVSPRESGKKLVSPRESEKKLVSPRESEKKPISPRESEKELVSPRESVKTSANALSHKATDPYIPVLDNPRCFNRPKEAISHAPSSKNPYDVVEKKLVSPRDSEKPSANALIRKVSR